MPGTRRGHPDNERKNAVQDEQNKQETAQPEAPQTAGESSNQAAPVAAASSSRKRVFIGLGVAAVVIIGASLAMQKTPGSSTPEGGTVAADITLITSDRNDVDCSAPAGVGSYRCGFADDNQPAQGDEANKLKPFYTTDRHLYLISGLFLNQAVQDRFKSEPPEGKPRDQLKRFTARCNLKVIGKVANVKVRWLSTANWSNPEEVEAATVVDCKVEG